MNRRRLATTALSLLLFALLFFITDVNRLVVTLRQTDPTWYAVAVLIFLFTYIPLTLRWQVLLRSVGYDTSARDCFAVIAISYGLNKLLPANSGDLARSKILQQYETVQHHSEVLGLVAIERVLDVLTLTALLLVFSVFVESRQTIQYTALIVGGGLIIAVAILSVRGARRHLFRYIPSAVRPPFERLLTSGKHLSKRSVVGLSGYSVTRWLLGSATLVPLAIAIDTTIGWQVAIFVTAAMSLTATLPFSPGGVGPVEAVGTGSLLLSGFTYSDALSLVVLQRSLGLVLTAVIGIVVYRFR